MSFSIAADVAPATLALVLRAARAVGAVSLVVSVEQVTIGELLARRVRMVDDGASGFQGSITVGADGAFSPGAVAIDVAEIGKILDFDIPSTVETVSLAFSDDPQVTGRTRDPLPMVAVIVDTTTVLAFLAPSLRAV